MSPSSATPCAAIKISVVSAVASWACLSFAIAPGPFAERIAIARPIPTETAARTRAITPKARLAIQKMCWPGAV